MELPVVSALEFEQIKSSIKNYIKTQNSFTGYDFEGSNLSMLIDILTYNTLYTSYNVNMAANELNLDTAVLRDNVVSIAKRLGYRSNSFRSSKLTIDLTINPVPSDSKYITLKKGNILSASNGNETFTFLTRNDIQVDSSGKTSVTIKDIELLEGTEFSIFYTVDKSNENQRFFIPNNFVDSNTIKAYVITDPTNNVEKEYTRKNTIVNISNSDEIFFVEEVQDQKYEVIFGDDVIGRKLNDGEIIRLDYIVSSGSKSNNINTSSGNIKLTGTVESKNASDVTSSISYSDITPVYKDAYSDGGSEYESVQSIKFRAPRYYAAQERAVTLSDYESIIKQIYPNTDLVRVVGGESLIPPQFGKVIITIKPLVGETVSFAEKTRIISELNEYKVGSVEVELRDPVNITIVANPTVIYDKSKTKNLDSELKSLINDYIQDYISKLSFRNFGGEYSDLSLRCGIKSLDPSIKFVSVPIYLSQKVRLTEGVEKIYDTNFYTSLNTGVTGNYYILSDPFCHRNISVPVHLAALTGCESDNKLYLITTDGNILKEVGTVDPSTGRMEYVINSCQSEPINIIVAPEVLDIVFGNDIVPSFETNEVSTLDDTIGVGDREDILGPDVPVIPNPNDLSVSATGDLTAPEGDTLISSPGGSLVISPIIPTTTVLPPAPDTDPNDFTSIEDFTPETNPYSCS